MIRPDRDEKLALRLEDLAGALDAGLPPDRLLSTPETSGDSPAAAGLVPGLLGAGLPLEPAERLALEAAERAGRLSSALRSVAASRRLRAQLWRDLRARLRYPLGLVLVGTVVFGLAAAAGLASPWAAVVLAGIVIGLPWAAAAWWRRACRRPVLPPARLPGLGGLLRDYAEVPYLEALQALYGAGVPLAQAHAQALRACPVAAVRARLFTAETMVGEGRPLTEALAAAGALDPETLAVLGPAERIGDLEAALGRALTRRRDTLRRRAERLVRVAGGAVLAVVYGLLAWQILAFWLGYYARFATGGLVLWCNGALRPPS